MRFGCAARPSKRWKSDTLLAHFAVIGDFSSDLQTAPTRDVANLVKSWNPDFVATVGDNNYPDGAASTIDGNVGQWYHQFISPYKGTYGGGATTNEFWPAIGNHDYDSADGTGYSPYLNYFTLPGNGRYYSVVEGNVQLFIVNSDSHEPDGTSPTSIQGQWLQNALATSTAQWKLVLFHHPAYSSGTTGSNVYMQWPFAQWGASAVISGHDHVYERLEENGIPYFVDGLGGESIFGFNTPIPGSQVRYENDYGAMLIDTSSTAMTFQFINRSNQVIDSYTLGAVASAPSVPTGLTATALSSTSVKLSWTDASPSLTQTFDIERSTDGGASFSPLASTLVGTTTYTDTGLAPGATYIYKVRADNSAGDSAYSTSASATTPTGSTTYLSDLAWTSATNGWGPVEKDHSNGGSNAGDGNTITLNGVTYSKGLGTNAISQIVYNINKQYSTFLSDIGMDDETGPGSVDFQVFFDSSTTPAYDSGVMNQSTATKSISLDVSNVTTLTLVVGDAGDGNVDDHGDWANARLQSAAPSQPPLAPTGLMATAVSPTEINVTWNDVLNESGYRVERSTDDVTFTPIGTTAADVTAYPDATVTGDTLYYYRVIATNASGDSPPSNVDFARPMQIPSDPSNLVATASSPTQINLSWQNNDGSDELDWDIERSPDGHTWTPLTTVAETEVYSDTTVQPNTTYYYHVRAGNLAGKSNFSNAAFATTPGVGAIPLAPSNLVALPASTTQINLFWQDNSNNETGFKIERSLDGSTNWTAVTTTAANATTYSDSAGLSVGTKYYYRVRATNAAGDSSNTTVASATTLASTSVSYIAAGSVWKYLDNGTNQGTAWRATSFNDTSWKSGPAQLGYGDGDEATVVSYGPNANNKYITTYFRDSFTVADASRVSAMTLQLIRDDEARSSISTASRSTATTCRVARSLPARSRAQPSAGRTNPPGIAHLSALLHSSPAQTSSRLRFTRPTKPAATSALISNWPRRCRLRQRRQRQRISPPPASARRKLISPGQTIPTTRPASSSSARRMDLQAGSRSPRRPRIRRLTATRHWQPALRTTIAFAQPTLAPIQPTRLSPTAGRWPAFRQRRRRAA